jgi:hypothetical protein
MREVITRDDGTVVGITIDVSPSLDELPAGLYLFLSMVLYVAGVACEQMKE